MIAFIRGILLQQQPPKMLIEVQGLGYEIEAPMPTFYQLPPLNAEISLFTHLVVREDAHLLYGFHDVMARDIFRKLIKVNGVGPKLALALLSIEVCDLAHYVHSNNSGALTRIPGVGKKTADRLIIELKDKLKVSDATYSAVNLAANNDEQDAISALIALGYKAANASFAVAQVLKEDASLSCSEIIKQALRQIK